jgi:hypothetical protein
LQQQQHPVAVVRERRLAGFPSLDDARFNPTDRDRAMAEASNDIVHTSLSAPERPQQGEENTPTTPTASVQFSTQQPTHIDHPAEDSAPETPTRHSFGGVRGQRALPEDPPSSQATERTKREDGSLKRGSSNRSNTSGCSDDVEMAEGDAEEGAEDDGSDNDSVTSDSQRPSKKKKGQRFFCTDFPPCQLSFTRSEHLARHIRYVKMVSVADFYTNLVVENIPENDRSSATVLDDSLVWTTFASMRRQYMSTKTFLETRLRLLAPDSKDKSEPIEYVRLATLAHAQVP